jgi:pimeloyl-ACP methyl ester carboxylesterase
MMSLSIHTRAPDRWRAWTYENGALRQLIGKFDERGVRGQHLTLLVVEAAVEHDQLARVSREAQGVEQRNCADEEARVGERVEGCLCHRLSRSLSVMRLRTGAEMRVTGPAERAAVVCVDGGQGGEVEGTWSASIEWLVRRLAPRFPELAFSEVKYRIKSWKRLDWCVEDARAAVRETGSPRTLLLGFSMGGAVAISAADERAVQTVVGLAPWIPDRLRLEPLRGRRLVVIHGMLDRWLPGIPGVRPKSSRRGFERARALGVEGDYTLLPGALHGIAVRAHWGRPLALPRAGRWAELVARELERFQSVG